MNEYLVTLPDGTSTIVTAWGYLLNKAGCLVFFNDDEEMTAAYSSIGWASIDEVPKAKSECTAIERIDTLYAFICTDDDGTEGVPAFTAANQMLMPMIGADLTRVELVRPLALELAGQGKKVTLAHFTVRTDIEVLE